MRFIKLNNETEMPIIGLGDVEERAVGGVCGGTLGVETRLYALRLCGDIQQ